MSNRGGARKGAGRPKKEKTIVVAFRINPAHEKPVREAVFQTLLKLKNLKHDTTT